MYGLVSAQEWLSDVFSAGFNPRRSITMPVVKTLVQPCPERTRTEHLTIFERKRN